MSKQRSLRAVMHKSFISRGAGQGNVGANQTIFHALIGSIRRFAQHERLICSPVYS